MLQIKNDSNKRLTMGGTVFYLGTFEVIKLFE